MPSTAAKIPVYRGKFGPEQAERLLWRAGFGPRRGQAEEARQEGAERGRSRADRARTPALRRSPPQRREGPAAGAARCLGPRPSVVARPHGARQPAADGADDARLARLVRHLERGRRLAEPDAPAERALPPLLARLLPTTHAAVTRDPAMLLWLSGTDNTKWSPNENYARELMELFTLGAGRGYSERDVREQARALTGFRNDWREGVGPTRFRFDSERHDLGTKRVFGRRGEVRLARLRRALRQASAPPVLLRHEALGLLHPDDPAGRGTRRASSGSTYGADYTARPVVGRSSRTRCCTRAREW